MTDRERALAATIAYAAGIWYMIHLARKNPEHLMAIFVLVGLVTVVFMLIAGGIEIIKMIRKGFDDDV